MRENKWTYMLYRTLRTILCTIMAVMVVCSCSRSQKSILPKGGGTPYDVLLVGDNSMARSVVHEILEAEAAGLPQPEPMFDVSATDSRMHSQTARCIVIVTVDSSKFTTTRIKYEKDVYTHPQIIVYVNTPSADRLRNDKDMITPKLHQLLTRAEMNAEIELLQGKHNPTAERMISNMFGCIMLIPASMKSSKRGRNFLWFSNDASSGMQNICMYSYEGDKLDKDCFIRKRDSIMRINIPGEYPNMHMHTVAESVTSNIRKEKHAIVMSCRGLWEMKNDAMGGPFVTHCIVDSSKKRVIVAEAFIYAPEMKKRNKIRQTEASLHTLKLKK